MRYPEYMPCKYTGQDISTRLDGIIARYKGEPVYVRSTGDGETVALYDVVKSKQVLTKIKSTDPEFDISVAEMGYANFVPQPEIDTCKEHVVYTYLNTKKQYKAGIVPQNVFVTDVSGKTVSCYTKTSHEGFVKSLMGIFPSVQEAHDLLKSSKDAVAISRDVAIAKTGVGVTFVYIRRKAVGWIAPDSDKINLKGEHLDWVTRRILEASGLKV